MDTTLPGPPAGPVVLVRVATREVVEARVVIDPPVELFDAVEAAWNPVRRRLGVLDPGAEHLHWDWRNKRSLVASGSCRLAAVEGEGQTQGLMAVSGRTRPSRLPPPGRPVLYVDYLEVAPWNLRSAVPGPRFAGVGRALLAAAVRLSAQVGSGGRVGLHSLPQAGEFYRAGCGMTWVGPDPGYHGLVYFEYTDEQAAEFLRRKRP
jgi:hypothetical protein